MNRYIHGEIGEEVRSISGYYVLFEEGCAVYAGKDILYAAGVGVVDNACCGAGGCSFVQVAGYIVQWKGERDQATGRPVSLVNPVTDEFQRAEISGLLGKRHPLAQVIFL